ncbi:hypothetical protein HUG20_02640 [Salicibibacter cibi]|uniref:Uncharacterized protein n=1 Tax=Salicibibacter cibi TaxID=2743001 RepID=A0A7T6Z8M8_9BACI|nr:hypothetical protein [Salicibibacter cibi]QQK78908.1 hypothetical protein HUG20_02640 [Salicibibacter cibi]
MSLEIENLKGLQAKSSPEHDVNQRWRRWWVTRLNDGETYGRPYLVGKHEEGNDRQGSSTCLGSGWMEKKV